VGQKPQKITVYFRLTSAPTETAVGHGRRRPSSAARDNLHLISPILATVDAAYLPVIQVISQIIATFQRIIHKISECIGNTAGRICNLSHISIQISTVSITEQPTYE